MFYRPASNQYIREGVPFEITMEVEVEQPPVTGIDPETQEEVVIVPGSTTTEVQTIQYPANWLNAATPEEKQALGLVEVVDVITGTPGDPEQVVMTEELVGAERRVTYSPRDPTSATAMRQARIKQEIASMEMEQAINFFRLTREFMLSWAEMHYTPEELAQNLGYQRLKAFDEVIAVKRGQL